MKLSSFILIFLILALYITVAFDKCYIQITTSHLDIVHPNHCAYHAYDRHENHTHE